jgi:hypothetical protein
MPAPMMAGMKLPVKLADKFMLFNTTHQYNNMVSKVFDHDQSICCS